MKNANRKILICDNVDVASQYVAQLIADAIRTNPRVVLGLATGSTPVGAYRELVRMHNEDDLDFSAITTFNLDEYIGLGREHPQSYRSFMQEQLFDHVNIIPEHTHVPDGMADDIAAHAKEYEAKIASSGGIDLQLLGIGGNGHIAFNEPSAAADSRTRSIDLAPSTVQANARFFDSIDEVPRQAITMGIGTIMDAKQIILMAGGQGKADAVAQTIEGNICTSMPASQLQAHSDVIYVLDPQAANQLSQETIETADKV